MGIELEILRARNSEEIDAAFEDAVTLRCEGVIVFDDPVTWSLRKRVVENAAKARLPVMYGYSEFVDVGGLISYGPYRPRNNFV